MNGFFRMHGGYNSAGTRAPLESRARNHKDMMRRHWHCPVDGRRRACDPSPLLSSPPELLLSHRLISSHPLFSQGEGAERAGDYTVSYTYIHRYMHFLPHPILSSSPREGEPGAGQTRRQNLMCIYVHMLNHLYPLLYVIFSYLLNIIYST